MQGPAWKAWRAFHRLLFWGGLIFIQVALATTLGFFEVLAGNVFALGLVALFYVRARSRRT
jgi:hypothetical protein